MIVQNIMASKERNDEAPRGEQLDDSRIVPMSKEQVHLGILQNGSHRADSTCTQYINNLRIVYRLLTGNETAELPAVIDWIKDAGSVVNTIKERQSDSAKAAWSSGSTCNKLTPLMVISKLRKLNEAYKQYIAAVLLAKNKQRNQTIKQTPIEQEQKNWIDMAEIKAKMEELGRKIRRQIVHTYQLGKPLEQDDIKTIFQHLILAANTPEPPK
jgi:hypothetical protein